MNFQVKIQVLLGLRSSTVSFKVSWYLTTFDDTDGGINKCDLFIMYIYPMCPHSEDLHDIVNFQND